MVDEPQGVMHVASQIWQVVFASQTLPVFCLALRKKAQYVVVKLASKHYILEVIVNVRPTSFFRDIARVLVCTLGTIQCNAKAHN